MPVSHIIGFDDAPHAPGSRGNVLVVGAVFSGTRLEGVISGKVRRDGANATDALVKMVQRSKFATNLQIVMLQGIALAGFNVVDSAALSRRLRLPVLVIVRRPPNLGAMRDALLTRIPGGARKWKIIENLGPMEPIAGVFVQRVGISAVDAEDVIGRTAVNGRIPEPLRAAHLIAGGVVAGESRGRT